MGKFIEALNAGSSIVGAGLGLALAGWQDRRQLKQQAKLQELEMQNQKRMAVFNQQQQMEMWRATGPVGQMEQLQKAGLNPGLIYGMGGGGGQSVSAQPGNVEGAKAPAGGGEIQGMGLMMQQAAMTGAQIDLIKAQAENVRADTVKKQGVDTDEAKTRIANNILNGVILDYTGKEAKSTFENVKEPWRDAEQRAYGEQLTLAGEVAQIMREFNQNKLMDLNNAQFEELLLKNAKTREEIRNITKTFDLMEEQLKGQKISNMILDLERKLQEQTGLDRNSDGFLKILGRLFVQLKDK